MELWAVGLITLGPLLALAIWSRSAGRPWHRQRPRHPHGLGPGSSPSSLSVQDIILLVERAAGPVARRAQFGPRLIAVCGLAGLFNHTPALDNRNGVRDAGGWVGALLGHPLAAGIGTAGAAVVFVALIIVAVLIRDSAPRSPRAGGRSRTASTAVGEAVGSWWKGGKADARPDGLRLKDRARCQDRAWSSSTPWPMRRPSPNPSRPMAIEPEPEPEPAPAAQSAPVTVAAIKATGDWKLPPMSYLPPTKQLRHDQRQIELAGDCAGSRRWPPTAWPLGWSGRPSDHRSPASSSNSVRASRSPR